MECFFCRLELIPHPIIANEYNCFTCPNNVSVIKSLYGKPKRIGYYMDFLIEEVQYQVAWYIADGFYDHLLVYSFKTGETFLTLKEDGKNITPYNVISKMEKLLAFL